MLVVSFCSVQRAKKGDMKNENRPFVDENWEKKIELKETKQANTEANMTRKVVA